MVQIQWNSIFDVARLTG